MASDSKRKSVDDISLKYAEDRFGLDSNEIYICATSHHDGYTQGRADALKELEQLKREAFNAAREEFVYKPGSILELKDWRFRDADDYLKQRKES